jgi:CRISPR-associated protein Csm4
MTHRFTKYRLTFPDGLHLDAGTYGFENTEVNIHSDTLFSALCCAAVLLDGEEGVLALKEKAHISSAFPFARYKVKDKDEWKDDYFFPKPLTPRDFDFPNYSDEKKFRKLKYLNQSLLEADLAGNLPLADFDEKRVKDGCWLAAEPDDEDFRVFKLSERPRITTDRTTQAAEIYHFSEVHFNEDGGLFFLADFDGDAKFKKQFESYLRLLGDEGIGADGTVGKGFFEIAVDENVEIKTPDDANAFLMLSLYNPLEKEVPKILPKVSSYEILTRRGWASAPGIATWRRRSLRMFGEGSVLRFENNEKPVGNIPPVLKTSDKVGEVVPNHDVWRYGRAFCLPIKI